MVHKKAKKNLWQALVGFSLQSNTVWSYLLFNHILHKCPFFLRPEYKNKLFPDLGAFRNEGFEMKNFD
jgi:hypothetical protein